LKKGGNAMTKKRPEPIVIQAWRAISQDKDTNEENTKDEKKARPEPIVIQAWRSVLEPKNK